MTTRDRIVVLVMAVLAIVAGVWLEVVSPERAKAQEAQAGVESARSALVKAQQSAASDHALSAKLASVRRSAIALVPAVPVKKAVPQIINEVSTATGGHSVDFVEIASNSTAGAAAPTSATTAAPTVEGMTPVPFKFSFTGGFFDLERLFTTFGRFVVPGHRGEMVVDGRLVVFDTLTLQALQESGKKEAKHPLLQGTVTATAFTAPTTAAGTGSTGSTSAPTTSGAGGAAGASPALVAGGKP
jgi:hypothetical protein